jgi:amino acid transporter
MSPISTTHLSSPRRPLGTAGVFISAVALVVSASTLVTDFTGFARLGMGFVISLLIGMLVVAPAIVSTCDLAVSYPRAGGIYHYFRSVIGGRRGKQTGLFFALLFLGTFLFGAAAETISGAQALRQMLGSQLPVQWFVVGIALAGITPNLWGLRQATWLNGGLLAIMLGIRWFFGLAGIFGWSRLENWEWANVIPQQGISLLGSTGIVAQGLALGFWAFVGIEGGCALVEEVRAPERSLPRGLGLALLAIFVTTAVMGIGIVGVLPVDAWRNVMLGASSLGGDAPHLAVGEAMFGPVGRVLMAGASVASTVSTLLIAFAAVPRLIMALGRDGVFFGTLSPIFARCDRHTGSPAAATLLVGAVYLGVALSSGAVVDCLYAAAYLWFIRYFVLHVLALINRWRNGRPGALHRRAVLPLALAGAATTPVAFHFAFAGVHSDYGPRALIVAGAAFLLATISWSLRDRRKSVVTGAVKAWGTAAANT